MITERYVEKKWHDENKKITDHGLASMRLFIMVGFILGLMLGFFITSGLYELLS